MKQNSKWDHPWNAGWRLAKMPSLSVHLGIIRSAVHSDGVASLFEKGNGGLFHGSLGNANSQLLHWAVEKSLDEEWHRRFKTYMLIQTTNGNVTLYKLTRCAKNFTPIHSPSPTHGRSSWEGSSNLGQPNWWLCNQSLLSSTTTFTQTTPTFYSCTTTLTHAQSRSPIQTVRHTNMHTYAHTSNLGVRPPPNCPPITWP